MVSVSLGSLSKDLPSEQIVGCLIVTACPCRKSMYVKIFIYIYIALSFSPVPTFSDGISMSSPLLMSAFCFVCFFVFPL